MDIKRLLFAGGTFACAIGIGFVMQNGDAVAARLDAPEPLNTPELAIATSEAAGQNLVTTEKPNEMAALVGPSTASVLPAITNIVPAKLDGTQDSDEASETQAVDVATSEDCGIAMVAETRDAAMIGVTLTAPCAPNQTVTIHHEGMMFSVLTDEVGFSEFVVPALKKEALVISAFESGEGAIVTHTVPDFEQYDRVVAQWRGYMGVELHAFELDAEYGDAGHVWYGAPRDTSAIAYQVGFLQRIGEVNAEAPLMADVYTFPSASSDHAGKIAMSVEAEINGANCGQQLTAQTIHISPFAERMVHDVEFSMPECDAVGDFVVLPLPLQDIQLASR